MPDDLTFDYGPWLVIGVLCLTVEMLAPGFSFLWFGMAALCTGSAMYVLPGMGVLAQILLFVGLSGLFLVIARYLPKRGERSEEPHLNQRAESMIGITFRAPHDLAAGDHALMLQGSLWQVRTPPCAGGTPLKVHAVVGMVLVAEVISS